MKPAQRSLPLRSTSATVLQLLDKHPHHAFVATVMACPQCMGTLCSQLDRLRELDARKGHR